MRKAMSMLELVVAIVVIGIVLTSLPLMFMQTSSSNKNAIQQEAIMAAQTRLNLVQTYEWDERTYDNTFLTSAVLDVANGDVELNRTVGSLRRMGHVEANKRRKFFPTPRNASNIGLEEATIAVADDIDDFNNTTSTTQVAIGAMDNQLLDFNITTRVAYVSDTATYNNMDLDDFNFSTTQVAGTTNIKMIQVTVLGEEINITLRSYASNIGENALIKRDFQ